MTITTPLIGTQNPWIHPLTEGTPPPVSERLIRALEAHIAAEADDAAHSRRLAETTADSALGVLLDLIVEDAERHEALLSRMVARLRGEVEFTDAPNALPVPVSDAFAGAQESVAALRTLIRNEQEGARYLRHLARQDAELYDGFFAILLDTFARDGEKHVHLLRYLLRHTESQ
jgi:rubrerythrin